MANIIETATFDSGVYQLEITDPVAGGASGIDNTPHKNLANRTVYLKAIVDGLSAGTGALTPILSKSVAGSANITLDPILEAVYPTINLTGALTAGISVIVPAAADQWVIANNTTGLFPITVKTAAGAGIVVPQGFSMALYCDATNVLASNSSYTTQAAFQQNAPSVANAGGTADAITAAYTPAVLALSNGMSLFVRATSANSTTTPTFSPNGLTATIIVKGAGSALAAGDIAGAGHWVELQYDSTLSKWVLLNPATGVAGTPGRLIAFTTIIASGTFTKNAATTKIVAQIWGGGGGGGGSGSVNAFGSFGGGVCSPAVFYTGSPAATYAAVIGAGGAGGVSSGGNGSNGSVSTFGGVTSAAASNGGPSGGALATISGGYGGMSNLVSGAALATLNTGTCGGSAVGLGGVGGAYAGSGVAAAANTGAGGGGAGGSNSSPGGAGGSGIIFVWEYA